MNKKTLIVVLFTGIGVVLLAGILTYNSFKVDEIGATEKVNSTLSSLEEVIALYHTDTTYQVPAGGLPLELQLDRLQAMKKQLNNGKLLIAKGIAKGNNAIAARVSAMEKAKLALAKQIGAPDESRQKLSNINTFVSCYKKVNDTIEYHIVIGVEV